jgi:hypothetical protein
MRKLILLCLIISKISLFAQCTPDLSCLDPAATSGVCPTSGLDTGTVGIPFYEDVSIKVPPDGSDFGQPFTTILSVDIISVDSLAPGLTYNCSPSDCSFPGNSTGCIHVYGTPTVAWDHKIIVNAMANVRIFFVNSSQPQTVTGFRSVVLEVVGIESVTGEAELKTNNNPNPFSEFTNINYYSSVSCNALFEVFDLTGSRVHERILRLDQGANSFQFNSDLLESGLYFYSISGPEGSFKKKMLCIRN